MSEKSCIFAAFFSAIRYYLCGILPAKSCKICAKTTAKSRLKNVMICAKSRLKNVIERSASALFLLRPLPTKSRFICTNQKNCVTLREVSRRSKYDTQGDRRGHTAFDGTAAAGQYGAS